MKSHHIATFYHFKNLESLKQIEQDLINKAAELDIRGLIILGTEGFNSTVSAFSAETLNEFKNFIREYFQVPNQLFKDSVSEVAPFRRFQVKQRKEIVTLGTPELHPDSTHNHHLSPEEWNQVLKEESDWVMIDTRNWYETKIGTFKNALDPKIHAFTEFPKFVEEQKIPKDKKMLIFCTGGIRCEKGILELQREGYKNVYQLEGGILNYLAKFPNDQFEGECFVFDHRVAVDQNLSPSKRYALCPHCGQPGETKITCAHCDSESVICEDCHKKAHVGETCSKNCAHHHEINPKKKGHRQKFVFDVQKYPLQQRRTLQANDSNRTNQNS